MTKLFRSNSDRFGYSTAPNPSPFFRSTFSERSLSLYLSNDEDDEEEQEEEGEESDDPDGHYAEENADHAATTPFSGLIRRRDEGHGHQLPVTAMLVAALRKSMVICSVEREEEPSMDISWPTNVRHVSHVTFDRFNGFLGLPVELEPEVPPKVPSASVSVFGVSAKSMQCSFDRRGNSVPTILLMMQNRLYSEGGLLAEGIFRINPENGQEEYVRGQLNKGVIPRGIDVHCLAGLIKAWFRELPAGVLDSLTPEHVMHCNTEDECGQLVNLLAPMEAALLDWAINLMADVVQHENYNKMNARNIAMIFAPNMTQMADPLTALIHAVQVMNFLKTLIAKTLREREESPGSFQFPSSSVGSPHSKSLSGKQSSGGCFHDGMQRKESEIGEEFWSFNSKTDLGIEFESISGGNSPVMFKKRTPTIGSGIDDDNGEVEGGKMERLKLRKGVLKLCRHPVFQLSKPAKKSGGVGVVNSREGDGEAWA